MFYLDEEMKKLKERGVDNPPSPQKMAMIMAVSFDRLASEHAFKIFRDNKFRNLLWFSSLSQVEQDRVFNELVVSGICLVMLTMEAPDLQSAPELKEYFQFVRDQMSKAHVNELKNYGSEKKYLKTWEKLIDLRYEEYHKEKLEIRSAALEMDINDGSRESLEEIQIMLPVNTIAIGAHRHILRGQTKDKDELFKYLVREFGRLYVQIRLSLEGKKITLWHKILVKLKMLFSKK